MGCGVSEAAQFDGNSAAPTDHNHKRGNRCVAKDALAAGERTRHGAAKES